MNNMDGKTLNNFAKNNSINYLQSRNTATISFLNKRQHFTFLYKDRPYPHQLDLVKLVVFVKKGGPLKTITRKVIIQENLCTTCDDIFLYKDQHNCKNHYFCKICKIIINTTHNVGYKCNNSIICDHCLNYNNIIILHNDTYYFWKDNNLFVGNDHITLYYNSITIDNKIYVDNMKKLLLLSGDLRSGTVNTFSYHKPCFCCFKKADYCLLKSYSKTISESQTMKQLQNYLKIYKIDEKSIISTGKSGKICKADLITALADIDVTDLKIFKYICSQCLIFNALNNIFSNTIKLLLLNEIAHHVITDIKYVLYEKMINVFLFN